jgi:hypothetical protein
MVALGGHVIILSVVHKQDTFFPKQPGVSIGSGAIQFHTIK